MVKEEKMCKQEELNQKVKEINEKFKEHNRLVKMSDDELVDELINL